MTHSIVASLAPFVKQWNTKDCPIQNRPTTLGPQWIYPAPLEPVWITPAQRARTSSVIKKRVIEHKNQPISKGEWKSSSGIKKCQEGKWLRWEDEVEKKIKWGGYCMKDK